MIISWDMGLEKLLFFSKDIHLYINVKNKKNVLMLKVVNEVLYSY